MKHLARRLIHSWRMELGSWQGCLKEGRLLDADGCLLSRGSLMDQWTNTRPDWLHKGILRGQDLIMVRHMLQQSNGQLCVASWHLELLKTWKLNLWTSAQPFSMETWIQMFT